MPAIHRECIYPWMGEPAFPGIPFQRDFTSHPLESQQILQGQGEPSVKGASICVPPEPADLAQPVLRVAPEMRQPRQH